jgi:hypothetical protein
VIRRVEDRRRADELHPGEPGPVVVVAVDGDRGLRPGAQPAHARECRARAPLRLLVDRAPDRAGRDRERDGQHARAPVAVEHAEMRDARLGQELASPYW